MKFSITPLALNNNFNLPLLIYFTNYNLKEPHLIWNSFKKAPLTKLTPWFKKTINQTSFNQTSFNQTFTLFKPFTFCLQKNKKYNLTASFIRSNLNKKTVNLNYLQLSPSVYKTITLFNNLLYIYIQQFKLYKSYLYAYLQLITNTNLLLPTLFHQQTNLPFYKNLFNQNLIHL